VMWSHGEWHVSGKGGIRVGRYDTDEE